MMSLELSNSALRAELGSVLKELQATLGRLAGALPFETRDAWIWQRGDADANALTAPPPELSREQTLEAAGDAIRTIKYEEGQDPHESRIAPGVLVLSAEGIGLADEVNRLKRTLADVLRKMQGRTEMDTDPATEERKERPLREVALEAFFFRRLHHWQATRELVVLRTRGGVLPAPEYIGFSWRTLRDVRRVTREELIEQLETRRLQADDPAAAVRDLGVVTSLPPKEPLALVKPGHTTPRANIAWPSIRGREPERQSKLAVLPLIVAGEALPPRLRKLPQAPTPRHYRLARNDTEIEPTPFLQTVAVHRYLPHVLPNKRAEGVRES